MTVGLPFGPEAARTARRLVDGALIAASASTESREDAALVVHELVMNGVLHGRPNHDGQLGLRYGVEDHHLDVTVLDGGTEGVVAQRRAAEDAVHGRGLAIVDALAEDWSVDRSDGTAVWARLSL